MTPDARKTGVVVPRARERVPRPKADDPGTALGELLSRSENVAAVRPSLQPGVTPAWLSVISRARSSRDAPMGLVRALGPALCGLLPARGGCDMAADPSETRAFAKAVGRLDPGPDGSQSKWYAGQAGAFIPENGYYPGWDLPTVWDNPGTAGFDQEMVNVVADGLFAKPIRRGEAPVRIKKFTNHGDPTWGSSIEDHALHFKMAEVLATTGDLPSLWARVRSITGDDLGDLPVMTTFSRSGMSAKPVPLLVRSGSEYTYAGEAVGMFCRRRQVRGFSTAVNEAVRPGVARAQYTLKQHPCYAHSTRENTLRKMLDARARGASVLYSDDASSFDLTASARVLDQVRGMYRRVLTPEEARLLTDAAVVPFTFSDAGGGVRVVPRRGVLASGQVTTTLDGTLLNILSLLHGLAHGWGIKPVDAARQWLEGRFLLLVQGDDSLMMVERPIDEARYVESLAELGFKRKLERYPVFLMTWYDLDKASFYNSPARAACRSVTRERPAAGPACELFGIASRWSLCVGAPAYDEWLTLFRRCSGFFREAGLREWAEVLDSRPIAETMEEELRTFGGTRAMDEFIAGLEESGELAAFASSPMLAQLIRGANTFREQGDASLEEAKSRIISWEQTLEASLSDDRHRRDR